MKRSRFGWAVGVIAPWCLGIGLVVSITADAGQNATIGGSYAALSARAAGEPADLVPEQSLVLDGHLGISASTAIDRSCWPRSNPGGAADFTQGDEIEPRSALKPNAGGFPTIDRTHKGDPLVGFAANLRFAVARQARPAGAAGEPDDRPAR